jgi:pimeloyl-ACP methyl ester carboxylesterase
MRTVVDGSEVYFSSGGRKHDPARPWMVLLHGAGFTHDCFVLQSRALAFDGWNVIAPDLPGHHLSAGKPLGSVGEMAAWTIRLMDAVGCKRAVLAGHSLGALVALEAAATATERAAGLVMIGAGPEIPVNKALLDLAASDPQSACQRMVSWSYSRQGHFHDNTWPGGSHVHFGLELMARNARGVLATDLAACANYKDGPERARALRAPTLVLIAVEDRMTPMKAGQALGAMIEGSKISLVEDSGHFMMTERPREVNEATRRFLAKIHQPTAVAI